MDVRLFDVRFVSTGIPSSGPVAVGTLPRWTLHLVSIAFDVPHGTGAGAAPAAVVASVHCYGVSKGSSRVVSASFVASTVWATAEGASDFMCYNSRLSVSITVSASGPVAVGVGVVRGRSVLCSSW